MPVATSVEVSVGEVAGLSAYNWVTSWNLNLLLRQWLHFKPFFLGPRGDKKSIWGYLRGGTNEKSFNRLLSLNRKQVPISVGTADLKCERKMLHKMSDRLSEEMSDRMPDRMQHRMLDRMSEYMPDRMPERLPGRMSEHVPYRMPGKDVGIDAR